MELPQDPAILLSFVNLKLRDYYPSLDEMCYALDIDRESLESTLNQAGFQYDSALNKFW
jgi:hypothetical protein